MVFFDFLLTDGHRNVCTNSPALINVHFSVHSSVCGRFSLQQKWMRENSFAHSRLHGPHEIVVVRSCRINVLKRLRLVLLLLCVCIQCILCSYAFVVIAIVNMLFSFLSPVSFGACS